MISLLKRYQEKIFNSIAFYPAVIALLLIFFGAIILALEEVKWVQGVYTIFPILVIEDADTARSILAAIISGGFTLLVFSFSMVMIVLNQASSNFSPRLLPGLISEKQHQIVLGVYIGFLAYTLMTLIQIEADEGPPSLAVWGALIGAVGCLGIFIFFINQISGSIRIDNITYNVYAKAIASKDQYEPPIKNYPAVSLDDLPVLLPSRYSGFFYELDESKLAQFVKDVNVSLRVLVPLGTMVLKGEPFCKLDELPEINDLDRLFDCFKFRDKQIPRNDFDSGIKYLTEIAVKAMSPGINDPGTASSALSYLTRLFVEKLSHPALCSVNSEETEYKAWITRRSFDTQLHAAMSSLRQYCKHDLRLMKDLMIMLQQLYLACSLSSETYKKSIAAELELLKQDGMRSLSNKGDLDEFLMLSRKPLI